MVTPMFDSARAAADRADQGVAQRPAAGPLAGVPVTVKDLIFVAGVPARGGAPALEHFVPEVDAAVVTALRKAGAIITCKTTTCESGYKLTADSPVSGVTRNPWRPRPHQRRIERRRSGSGRRRMRPARAGDRRRRFDPGTGLVLRRVRDQAHLRPGAPSARILSAFVGLARPHRPHRPDGARRGAAARGDRRHDVRDAASLPVTPRRFDATPDRSTASGSPSRRISALPRWRPRCARHFARGGRTRWTIWAPSMVADDSGIRSGGAGAHRSSRSPTPSRRPPSSGRDAAVLTPFRSRLPRRHRARAGLSRHRLRGCHAPPHATAESIRGPVPARRCAGHADRRGHRVRGRHPGRGRDRRPRGRPHLGWSPFSWPINLAGLPAATIPCGFDRDGLPIGLADHCAVARGGAASSGSLRLSRRLGPGWTAGPTFTDRVSPASSRSVASARGAPCLGIRSSLGSR